MITIAGGIILAVVIAIVGLSLLEFMFVGFNVGAKTGCFTMIFFGSLLFLLGSCVFGG